MNEEKFWDNKYREGGISGLGSIGKYRYWKWIEIIKVIGRIKDLTFIDVGCGDMKFWIHYNRLRKCKEYLGIDVSEEIINRNIKKYPNKKFLWYNAKEHIYGVSAKIVLVMDLLFHIMNIKDFEQILYNLCMYSEDWIIIYNWINNPFAEDKKVTDGISQYYRNLEEYDTIFISNNFELKKVVKCPHDPYGALYFYREMIY